MLESPKIPLQLNCCDRIFFLWVEFHSNFFVCYAFPLSHRRHQFNYKGRKRTPWRFLKLILLNRSEVHSYGFFPLNKVFSNSE